MFRGNVRDEDTPLHKTVREACVNMLTNADFYGRRGVVVQKGEEGFRFANPGSMRVSLSEALQDSASDPRNGVIMKMLSMVEYGERAGSGLQGIFKTWESVFHCKPQLDVSTSGGVDRTILSLNFEGRQPDIEAMKRLYGGSGEIISQNSIPKNESKRERIQEAESVPQTSACVLQNAPDVTQNSVVVPQNVTQSSAGDPQNEDNNIQKRILERLQKDSSISRESIAKDLDVSKRTVARYLSKLNIIWAGSSKTGHWILPEDLTISSL